MYAMFLEINVRYRRIVGSHRRSTNKFFCTVSSGRHDRFKHGQGESRSQVRAAGSLHNIRGRARTFFVFQYHQCVRTVAHCLGLTLLASGLALLLRPYVWCGNTCRMRLQFSQVRLIKFFVLCTSTAVPRYRKLREHHYNFEPNLIRFPQVRLKNLQGKQY